MWLSTMAAARQNEMKASMAVVATRTRGAPDACLWDEGARSLFMNGPAKAGGNPALRSRLRRWSKCSGTCLYAFPAATWPSKHTFLPIFHLRATMYLYHYEAINGKYPIC